MAIILSMMGENRKSAGTKATVWIVISFTSCNIAYGQPNFTGPQGPGVFCYHQWGINIIVNSGSMMVAMAKVTNINGNPILNHLTKVIR